MSMISAKIDELRAAAQACRSLGRHEMEQTLLDAADLILELRDNLQCANEAVRDAEHDESMAWDRVRKAETEADKLRELVKYAHDCAIHSDHATCDDCERMNGCCILVDRMRELGVEVDG